MNIKSLLLGSAAALVAVSGARAADVIVPVAPEPAEYVRVCDVYGTGFYYIPGTETCLSVSGYVRFKYTVQDLDTTALTPAVDGTNAEGDDYAAYSSVRGRLNFDAREETELGTLRGFLRVQATNMADGDASFDMDLGYIQLGGLTMGYLDSLWAEGDGLLTDTDLSIGDLTVNRVSYTYAANGFSAALSLEDDATGDFAPDVVGKLAYSGGWGSIYLAGSYDEEVLLPSPLVFGRVGLRGYLANIDVSEMNGLIVNDGDGAFAVKGGLSLKDLVMTDSELKIEGSYAFDPSAYSTIGVIGTGPFARTLPVEWSAGAGYAQSFGKLGIAVSGIYGETFDLSVGNAPFAYGASLPGNAQFYQFVGNVGYEITNNFDVLAEISYADFEFDNSAAAIAAFGDDNANQTAGFLQFIRSF